jgi:hypothetical protein
LINDLPPIHRKDLNWASLTTYPLPGRPAGDPKSPFLMRKFSTLRVFAVASALSFASWLSSQTVVFSDDFSTAQNASYTTSGAIGASAWSITRNVADWGGRRNTSPAQLELTNDVGATANANGWVLASTSSSSFSSPYSTTLSSNPGLVTWTFNMRQIRPDPAGFGAGSYGVAYIIAGTTSTNNNTGTGYAVVLGQSGATIQSASFTIMEDCKGRLPI